VPGSATLGTNLIDSLLDVVDDLRDGLHTDFGVRQYRVFVVTRAWSGGFKGEGTATDTEIEIVPQPLIEAFRQGSGWSDYSKEACGLDEAGEVTLSEISLTYTHPELVGPPALESSEMWVRIEDAHGQLIPDSYWQAAGAPESDRINTIGWIWRLRRMSNPGSG
jgi:hypothetical protein